MEIEILSDDKFNIMGLNRTEMQVVAAACQVAAYQWRNGPPHGQRWSDILEKIASDIVVGVFASNKTRQKHKGGTNANYGL